MKKLILLLLFLSFGILFVGCNNIPEEDDELIVVENDDALTEVSNQIKELFKE
jgi:hypothetical protein